MKILAYILFALCGITTIVAFGVIEKTSAPGISTYIGAFIIPFLFGWWGMIILGKTHEVRGANGETPSSHVRCPDCKELVLKEARVCKHCMCRLAQSDL
jgi:hypothetical protein